MEGADLHPLHDTLARVFAAHANGDQNSWFQGNPTCVVDAVQQKGDAILLEILVTSQAGPSPMPIVINNKHPTRGKPGKEVHKFVFGGLIPVGIESEQGDGRGSRGGYCVLDPPLYEMNSLTGIARGVDEFFTSAS